MSSHKSYSTRIIHAGAEDAIAHIAGLALHGAGWWLFPPISLLARLFRIRQEQSPLQYTDWVLERWTEIYADELSRCLKFTYKANDQLLPQVLVLDNTIAGRRIDEFYLELDAQEYQLPEEVRAMTETAFRRRRQATGKNYSDQENLRLCEIRDGIGLLVQKVRYEYYMRTNLVLDVKLDGQQESLRQYLHRGKKLESLRESPLANNLGVNILLFTADGSLVIQQRSHKVAFRAGEYCSSASGTFATGDVRGHIAMSECHNLREAFEELGICSADIKENSLQFLGITRELIRGGEPELFFCASSVLSKADLLSKWRWAMDKSESRRLKFFSFGDGLVAAPLDELSKQVRFCRRFDDFLDKFGGKASVPFLANVALWQKSRLASR